MFAFALALVLALALAVAIAVALGLALVLALATGVKAGQRIVSSGWGKCARTSMVREVRQTGTIQAETGSTCLPAEGSRLCGKLAMVQPGAHTTTFVEAPAGFVKRGGDITGSLPLHRVLRLLWGSVLPPP